MPYVNYHSARQRDPGDFKKDAMTTKSGKKATFATIKITDGLTAIVGKLKNPPKDSKADSTHVQTYRFDKSKWTVARAKKWLKDNDEKSDSFEAAKDTKKEMTASEFRNLLLANMNK